MEFPPPDRHDRISRTCSLFRCPFQSLHRPAAILPAAELQTHPAEESLRTKYIPRQSRDHINKAPSRVPFCLGKMVRSDRLECRRKLGIKEKSRLQPSAWWEGRSVWIGKGVPDNPQKAGSAAEALRGRLQPGSRSKRDFCGKGGMERSPFRCGIGDQFRSAGTRARILDKRKGPERDLAPGPCLAGAVSLDLLSHGEG